MTLNTYACLVFGATTPTSFDPSALGWSPGPLPVPLPAHPGHAIRVANRSARAQYFATRVQGVLYGLEEDPPERGCRWHLAASGGNDENLDNRTDDDLGNRIEAWELLRYEDDGLLFLVAHVQIGQNPVESIASLTAVNGVGRAWLETQAPKLIRLDGMRPRSMSHLTWQHSEMPAPELSTAASNALNSWSILQQWQWFLASGVPPEAMLPDVEAPDLEKGTVWLSSDWRALVLRDGIAYVATTASESLTDATRNDFHQLARVYVRTLHLDAFLLGILQVATFQRHADETSRIGDSGNMDAARIVELEARLLQIRAKVWWQDIGQRGEQVSSILRTFQNQHRLADIYNKIVEDLTDASRYTLARQAALAEIARQSQLEVQEQQEVIQRLRDERQRAFEQSLSVVSFVLLPISLIFSAMALWSDPSRMLWLVSVTVSILFAVLVLTFSPPLRNALRKQQESD